MISYYKQSLILTLFSNGLSGYILFIELRVCGVYVRLTEPNAEMSL